MNCSQMWSKVTPLTFSETTGFPDIDILFAEGPAHDGCSTFNKALAHAITPGILAGDASGDAHFRDNNYDIHYSEGFGGQG